MMADEQTATVASFVWLMKDMDRGQEILCPDLLFCLVADSLAPNT